MPSNLSLPLPHPCTLALCVSIWASDLRCAGLSLFLGSSTSLLPRGLYRFSPGALTGRKDEQGNAVAPQRPTTRFVGCEHEDPHHDIDHQQRNQDAARTAAEGCDKRSILKHHPQKSQAHEYLVVVVVMCVCVCVCVCVCLCFVCTLRLDAQFWRSSSARAFRV
jgi:hypothetical protein